jgi:hypothetical protein
MSQTMLSGRFVVLGVLALAACAPESDPGDEDSVDTEELAATAVENVERALRGTHRAGSFIADSQSVADSLGTVAGESQVCDDDDAPCLPDGTCPEPVCEVDSLTVADLQEARAELDESISDFVQTLKDEIFTEANVESEDDDSVTFYLGPDVLCGSSEPAPSAPGEPEPIFEPNEVDPECAESVQRLQPRLRLSSAGDDDVDVALLLTANRHNPVTLELHHDHVAVVADLGEIKATLDSVGEDTGALRSLDGKVSLELRQNGELDYSASANVLEEIVVVADQEGSPVRVSLGASAPTYEVRLNGNARTITGLVDFGEFRVSGPMNAFRDFFDDSETFDELGNPIPEKSYSGEIELVVPGLEGRATYDGAADAISFGNFGLGNASSTLKWNGIPLAQLDLNAALGRHFDIALASPAGGGQVLTLSPTFDLSMVLNFMPVADQIDDLAQWLLNDTLHVWFDGSNPSVQIDEDQFRVVSGTLNMTSASAPAANVSVSAGMCVVEVDPPNSSHELLGAIGAGVCQAP